MIADTLVVVDTQIIEKPVLVERTSKEHLLVAVHDTTWIHDTLYVALPMETKTYKGEDYLAEVSGYNPSLDRIEVYPKTVVISKTETTTQSPSLWRYEVTVGLDYEMMWGKYITPNVGAEIGYKKLTLGVECGVNMNLVNSVLETPMPYLQASIKYRLAGR